MPGLGIFLILLGIVLLVLTLRWLVQHYNARLEKCDSSINLAKDLANVIIDKKLNSKDLNANQSSEDVLFFANSQLQNEEGQSTEETEQIKNQTQNNQNIAATGVIECRPSAEFRARKVLSEEELARLKEQRKGSLLDTDTKTGELLAVDEEYDGIKKHGVRDAEREQLSISQKQKDAILALLALENSKRKVDNKKSSFFNTYRELIVLSVNAPENFFWLKTILYYSIGQGLFMAGCVILFPMIALLSNIAYSGLFVGVFVCYHFRCVRRENKIKMESDKQKHRSNTKK